MQSTFIGQCKQNSNRTIVVKTHELSGKSSNEYDKAVLIIRNPFDALLAEFNRRNSGKTLVASKQSFLSKRKFFLQSEPVLLTCTCNIDRPYTPLLYSKMWVTGVYIII